jgi:hypothetical protein
MRLIKPRSLKMVSEPEAVPTRVRLLPKPGKRIIEGLEDALAYAKGDTTKGRIVHPRDNVIATPKPLRRVAPAASADTTKVDEKARPYNIILSEDDSRTVKGFAVTAVGEVLGFTGVTITRWVKQGLIPKPVFETARGAIYHLEEVRSFYRILSEHTKQHRQYRAEHADLRRRLFEENARIRSGLFPSK